MLKRQANAHVKAFKNAKNTPQWLGLEAALLLFILIAHDQFVTCHRYVTPQDTQTFHANATQKLKHLFKRSVRRQLLISVHL